MSLRADEIVPIAALAQITREQVSTRVPLAPDAVCRVPSSSHGESQLGMPPCHPFAWTNSLKLHLLTATWAVTLTEWLSDWVTVLWSDFPLIQEPTKKPQAFTHLSWSCLSFSISPFPSLLLFALLHSLAQAPRALDCDAASCSCRGWPFAALAHLCLARTFPVPLSLSPVPTSLSPRQDLPESRHHAAPLSLGCSLFLVS